MAKFIMFDETVINTDYIICIEKCYSIGDDKPYVIRISVKGSMYYQYFETEEERDEEFDKLFELINKQYSMNIPENMKEITDLASQLVNPILPQMEDFVTLEIAKKLKEKGFRDKCLAYYDVEDNVGLLYNTQYTDEVLPCQYTDLLQCHNTGEAETQSDDSGFCVDAPTISQVLKWLREEKGYHICIGYDGIYSYDVVRIIDCEFAGADDDYDTYEQATLTGIEYVIDNLI